MSPTVRNFPSTHPSLIAKLQDSHAEAWSRFFQRYQWVVLNWCRRKGLSLADAEDLTQSFMADAPRKLRTYQMVDDGGEPNRFRAWLKTVVKDSASMAHIEELLGLQAPAAPDEH